MQNGIFKLDWSSIVDAAIMAGIGAVLGALVGLLGNGFDLFSADWVVVGKQMANVAFAAAVLSIAKDLFSNNQGQVLGVGKPY